MQRLLDVSDRSSGLETSTINLQDLNSCRGDNVNDDNSSVNRSHCQKIAPKPSNTYRLERIPPPAHNQVILNQQTQQQNGYLDLDRWNLTTLQNAKIIATAPGATTFVQQPTQVVQTANLVATNPTLLVAAAPTVSYFPTFHVAQTTPHLTQLMPQQQTMVPELQHTIEISTLNLPPDMHGCEQTATISYSDVQRDDRPQVIVPDIEEELGFLQQSDYHSSVSQGLQQQSQQLQVSNSEIKKSANGEPNSGFMTSYLKFLQGDKDNSPPPSIGAGEHKTSV